MYYYHKISKPLAEKIDLARAFAALMVLFVHLRGGFFVKYGDLLPEYQNIFNYCVFFITRIGHECVIVFFILSGFLVGGNFLSEYIQRTHNTKKYFVNRVVRMWIVLLPTLIIGYILSIIYFNISNNSYFLSNLDLMTFFGNVFFLQNVAVFSFANNSPLWSLTNEFWYYLLWPLCLYLLFSKNIRIFKFLVLFIIIFILSYIAPDIMRLFVLWILGALIRFVPKHKIFSNSKIYFLSIFVFFFSIVYSNVYKTMVGEYLVGLAFSFVMILWINREQQLHTFIKKPSKIFAEFSFSVYAIHYVLIFGILNIISKTFSIQFRTNQASIYNWLLYLFTGFILVFICYIFYYFSERHTFKLRTIIYNQIVKVQKNKTF